MSMDYTEIDSKLQQKVISTLRICHLIDIPLDKLFNDYNGILFEDSTLDKSEVFSNLLKARRIPTGFIDYAERRLGDIELGSYRDERSTLAYAIDLILGWIIEDLFVKWCQINEINAVLDGKDSGRELLSKSGQIGGKADILLRNSGKKIEVIQDYSNFWARNKIGHLRNEKLDQLLADSTILLGFTENQVYFFNFGDHVTRQAIMADRTLIPRHKYFGNKPAWEIPFTNPMTMTALRKVLLDI